MIENKLWGSTEELFDSGFISFHKIIVKKGGYCSKHLHENKCNIIIVESGELFLQIWGKKILETILKENDSIDIENNTKHKFKALEDTIAYELYYSPLFKDKKITKDIQILKSDIIRDNSGGLK